jgi:type 1 glutamine amidotransferase
MKLTLAAGLIIACLIFTLMCRHSVKPESRILVFSKTKGFRHSSIPAGKAALYKLGAENGFAVDTTEDDKVFTEVNLKKYQAIVFLSTTGDVLNNEQQAVFEKYIRSGKGFVGIHAATDTEYEWPWYNKLVGGYFESHPKQQDATIDVIDKKHPATSFLPEHWKRFDEWYNFKSMNPEVKVLAKLDESSYEGGKMGGNHPIAWYHAYDGGRAFYTACGHTDASFTEPMFLKHVLGGITYAMGKKK